MAPDDTTRDWHFLRSTTRERLGKLTLREDVWRLPTGVGEDLPDPARRARRWAWCRSWTRDHVLLIRQFRHLLRGDSWELPGGGGQPGETPEAAAQRELREEGGYRAGRLTFLTRFFPSAAYLDETAYCYIGEELVADPLASDDDEFFERRVGPLPRGGGDGAGRPHHRVRLQDRPPRRRPPPRPPPLSWGQVLH